MKSIRSEPAADGARQTRTPWFQRSARWLDVRLGRAATLEVAWWRAYWQRLGAQGVIIPADVQGFAAVAAAAREDRLAVVARLNVGALDAATMSANPAWAARVDGRTMSAPGGVAACVHGAYGDQRLPALVTEVIQRLRPDGVLGVGWSGLDRSRVCQCDACAAAFGGAMGQTLPANADWTAPAYFSWLRWSRVRRVELWTNQDRAAQAAGGVNCRWIGLVPLARDAQAESLLDMPAIASAAAALFTEQAGAPEKGRLRSLLGDGRYLTGLAPAKQVVLLTPAYQAGEAFAFAASPAAETRLRMTTGLAAGLAPAVALGDISMDARSAEVAPPVFAWHRDRAAALADRRAVAQVGLVWSAHSAEVYGRDRAETLAEAPYKGMTHALIRAHVPYRAIAEENLTAATSGLAVLILPSIGALSDAAVLAVRTFVQNGGSLIATGDTSRFDAQGNPRADYALADVFGAHLSGPPRDRLFGITSTVNGSTRVAQAWMASEQSHLRISPEYAGRLPGPHKPDERNERGARHPILAGFDKTDILPYGGPLGPLTVDPGRTVLATFVPGFPFSPIDEVYMRVEHTTIPGIIVGTFGKGRVVFLPADVDRRFGVDPIVDHATLLMNTIRWALGPAASTVTVTGPGITASALYQQGNSLVLHLMNLTGADNQAHQAEQHFPMGPIEVSVALPQAATGTVAFLVGGPAPQPRRTTEGGQSRLQFAITRLVDHEVAIIR